MITLSKRLWNHEPQVSGSAVNVCTVIDDKNELKSGCKKLDSYCKMYACHCYYSNGPGVMHNVHYFVISGPNGAHFSGSVETESLRAPPKKDLRLASLTRSLHMDAPDGMSFKSAAGSVGITSLKDVTIKSMNGKV